LKFSARNASSTNGTTSNMRSNLSALHPSDFAIMEKEEKVGKKHPKVSNSKSTPMENWLFFPVVILDERN